MENHKSHFSYGPQLVGLSRAGPATWAGGPLTIGNREGGAHGHRAAALTGFQWYPVARRAEDRSVSTTVKGEVDFLEETVGS
jgi:hypothetical protein